MYSPALRFFLISIYEGHLEFAKLLIGSCLRISASPSSSGFSISLISIQLNQDLFLILSRFVLNQLGSILLVKSFCVHAYSLVPFRNLFQTISKYSDPHLVD
ncbi:hypothetical protein F511_41739 [Dorcoceras hygrometricum]|uniref:Uncharacterized protein n=1 Tax=Dorcoceras hygrometricum TaxID=472368 RepID=A0A2Z7B3N2_9LAMI|nr:hypothetical protein F511_41739 [Dorcoceras hygrometricum]